MRVVEGVVSFTVFVLTLLFMFLLTALGLLSPN